MAIEKTRKERNSNKKNKKKFFRKRNIGLIILFAFLIFIAYVGITQIFVPSVRASSPLSILLVGSDIDSYREEHYSGTKPEKTDSLMVLTFDPETYRVVTTSIPRDTAIDDACGDIRGKVNEIYPAHDNDISCLEESIEGYLNIPIDYYVKVNMDQLEAIIDEVGPLKIVVHAQDGVLTQENVAGTMQYTWTDGETVEMDADEALTYSRARHDSEKDYGRGRRQQQVISACIKNILEEGLNLSMIKELLSLVDTDMEPLLAKKYKDYAENVQENFNYIAKGKMLEKDMLDDSVWKNMFKYFEYSDKSVSKENIEKFQKYLIDKYSKDEIKEYFFESNQIYNDTMNGYYVTPYDQLEEISNKLRINLGLKEEKPSEPKNEFGVFSLSKQKTAGSDNNTTNETDNYYDDSSTNDTQDDTTSSPKDESESTTVQDDDGDGISNEYDICSGSDDSKDTDEDGTPDGCDDYDNTQDNTTPENPDENGEIDTDEDGINDSEDICPGLDDNEDLDGNSIPDCKDNEN